MTRLEDDLLRLMLVYSDQNPNWMNGIQSIIEVLKTDDRTLRCLELEMEEEFGPLLH